jgi:predicted nucleotide-binding protein (sugar kinase/HSP70/actin superfamily)
MIKSGTVSGIINIMPFSCMPGLIVTALSGKIRKDYENFPWLNIDYDGTRGGNVETRLEAFIHQIRK